MPIHKVPTSLLLPQNINQYQEDSAKDPKSLWSIHQIKQISHEIARPISANTQLNEVERKKLGLCEDVLVKVRNIFKGGLYKSPNKIRLNRTVDELFASRDKLIKLRNEATSEAEMMYQSINNKIGNCGELANIAYTLLFKSGLNPLYIEFVNFKTEQFDHALCQVTINNIKYFIDPWSNIICRREDYLDTLSNKLISWSSKGKYISMGIPRNIVAKYLVEKDKLILIDYIININDVRNLEVVSEGVKARLNLLSTNPALSQLK